MKKSILIFAAVASVAAYEAASTVPAAPGPAPELGIASRQALSEPPLPAIGGSDSLAIREAHSDGGYWYWEERQRAPARIELAAKPR